jgi:ferric-dicitrate binding protein FerR (iron transport regulator)
MTRNDKRERCQQLIMALIDGEISAAERTELERLLEKFPEMRQELEEFQQLKEVTKTMKLRSPDPDVWQTYWANVYNRIERGIAWFLVVVGLAILATYGIAEGILKMMRDPEYPLILKIGSFAAILGGVLLFLSVIREKLFIRKHERYKEVQR